MRKILAYLFLSFTMGLIAQKKDPEHYSYPFAESYQQLTIRVNAVILYKDDGTGNFDLNNPEEKSLLLEYLDQSNKTFSNFQKPADLTGSIRGQIL